MPYGDNMDSMLLNVILVFIGSLIGSIGSSSVLLYLLKRRDKIEDLAIHNNRLGEAVNLLMETNIMMIEILHDAKLINGNGDKLKSKIEDYLAECTKKGFFVDK